MSKLDKLMKIAGIGAAIAKPLAPGAVGEVLDAVTKGMAAHTEDPSAPSAEAIRTLADINDKQTAAILALNERIEALEAKQ